MCRQTLSLLAVLVLLPAGAVLAQEEAAEEEAAAEAPPGWDASAELTFVDTTGNSETTTLGFGALAVRSWEAARLTLEASGLRAETGTTTRRAVGTPAQHELFESSSDELTAESYLLRAAWEGDIRDDFFWFAGLGWERNEFAGFRGRTSAVAGVGHLWIDTETAHWKTTYGVTWTAQDDLVEDPAVADEFAGLRLTSDYIRRITPTTDLTSLVIVDESLDDTDDLRVDATHAIAVSLNRRLALKVGLQLLLDNQPALGEVPLELPDGTPTGETVTFALDDLDTVLRVALVAKL